MANNDRRDREGRGRPRTSPSRSSPATSGSTSASRAWSRQEDVAKAEGELKVAEAQIKEAEEQRAINKAELDLAKQILKEHTIVAPFDGIVIKRMKNPGESVRANEAVVEIGNLTRLCADAYVPLKYAFRVKEGQIVEIQPRLAGGRGERSRSSSKTVPRQDHLRRTPDPGRSPRPPCGSAPSSRTRTSSCGPGLKVQMTIFLTRRRRRPHPPAGRPLNVGRGPPATAVCHAIPTL